MLPAKGPWPHPYYALPDAFADVSFTDAEGARRIIRVRHKVLGDEKLPKLVLVHGLMTSSYSWRYVIEPLAKTYRVFALDLVGAGISDKPGDMVYSVANVARFLAAYVDLVAGEPVYLVGNSLGGLYCVKALLDRGSSLARRFVLMHSPGYPFYRTRLLHAVFGTPGLGPALSALTVRIATRWPRAFVAKNVHYLRKDMMSEEEAAEYGTMFATRDSARVFLRILEESLDPSEHDAITGALAARRRRGEPFPCPVRILYARKDVMVPASFGPLYHADIPGSELVWMDDASHFLQVDAPERTVEQIVSFDA
ncbi:MAG: alpha/beta hydrolase [Deltaproteobacteria bacterium]|nr:alpha/beta hydrolase [Deltaproteobacteria bacterium]